MLAADLFSQATLRFAILGLATGSLTALVALAIVIVYRVSGVLNFSAGAMGGIGAFVCYGLRDSQGWPVLGAIVAGLAVGAALGLLTFAVMDVLRDTSLLTRLIATLALFSLGQGFMVVVWGTDVVQPKPFLNDSMVNLGGELRVGQDRLILIGVALLLALLLRLFYQGSMFGLATAAVSENRRVAASSGWDTRKIQLINFTVAGLLSAAAAIALAPIVTLNAAVLSVSVIPALAAALVGRFESFQITVLAALGIGVLQSEISLFQFDIADLLGVDSQAVVGLAEAVPLVIILGGVVASGRVRSVRGERAERLPLPGTGKVNLTVLAIGIAVGAFLLIYAESFADALIVTFAMSIIVASVVVVTGYGGQLSLAQYSLAGFGAWVAAHVADRWDLPFVVVVMAAIGATVALGALIALPVMRTRGVNLAVVTLSFALVLEAIVFQNSSLTGGFEGINVPSPSILGFDLDPLDHPQRYAAFLLAMTCAVGLLVANVRRGRTGRRMIAVRSNERAAAALGISVVGIKLYTFAIGAGIAALGGVLLAFRNPNVQFTAFDAFSSVLLVEYAVIGGLGWISGAVLGVMSAPGAVMSRIVTDLFPNVDNIAAWLAIANGIGVVVLLRRSPDGIAALWARIGGRLFRFRKASRSGNPAESEAPRTTVPPCSLAVEDVTVRFGGVIALNDVSFAVSPGEVLGVIGPNGAGKTTLLDVITGFTQPNAGRVLLNDQDISRWSPERRARHGVGRSWQAVELFNEMTVLENLLVAEDRGLASDLIIDVFLPRRQRLSAFAEAVVEELGLAEHLDATPDTLAHGVMKRVGIARAMISNPGVILLDEPAAGLDSDETRELEEVIRRIAEREGIGVIVIEHDMALIFNTCDRIVTLDFGRKIAEGTPAEIQVNQDVINAYLGEETDASETEASAVGSPT
ncbi:MAG: branched-chain amino acid ABC transporter permease/ATP-binding protein [Ilumatobacteraceae bacterium]